MKISHIEKSVNGYLAHQESETEDKEPIVCQEIRGGVIVPDVLKGRPGYYLLLGRTREESKNGLPLLVFLKEESEYSREALIKKLIHDESKFRYHKVYTQEPVRSTPGEPRDSFFMDLRKAFLGKIPWVKLSPAFYQNDIMHGINLFAQWHNERALEIPRDTILGKQLGQIKPDVPPDELYAFQALSHVLSGFKLQEMIHVDEIGKERMAILRKDSLKGLIGVDRVAWAERDHIFEQIEKEENEYFNDFLSIRKKGVSY